jgi:hypothetical protein
VLFFRLDAWALTLVLAVLMAAATTAGLLLGRVLAGRSDDDLREPFGILQAALIGFMGLILAFGLSLAVGRYESRRTDVVDEATAIGTAYLRAQTLAEPIRSESLLLLRDYTDASIRIADDVPGSAGQRDALRDSQSLQRDLWSLAGEALGEAPTLVAPQLYVESLTEAFEARTSRAAGLVNRVPTAVIVLEVVGAALALAVLALHLATFGRGIATVAAAAALVTLLLVVTFDLDRPTRGLIRVPSTPLTAAARAMELPPAAEAPPAPEDP